MISKVVGIVGNVLLTGIILVLGVILILKFSNVLELYKVETGSMRDGIMVGDYILVQRVDDYREGDIVTYRKTDGFVTHRIIRIENEEIVTKGDANNTEDEPIKKDDIVGKVVYKSGLLNFIIRYKFTLVSLALSLYLLSIYFGKEESKEEKKEEEALA